MNLVDKIDKSDLFLDPFPHLYTSDFFSDDVYAQILDNFPSQKYLSPLSSTYFNRFILDLDKYESRSITKLPKNIKDKLAFWMEFRNTLLGNDFMESLLVKFEEYLPKKYWKDAYPTARLSLDYPPYSIGGHRDRHDKLISVMIYTPKKALPDDVEENYGTALLSLKDPKFQTGIKHQDLKHFNKEKVAHYKPNHMFSWAVTPNSYHGVYPLKYSFPRPTIGYFIKNTTNTNGRLDRS